MLSPKQYSAMTIETAPDPFTGKKSRKVTGWYYRHEGPSYAFNEGQEDQTKHYIMETGFADWNMARPVDMHEIQIETLEEADGKE